MADPLTILVIDDEEIVHKTIGDYLRACGHGVDNALSGAEGITMANAKAYDLVLTDVRMPGMDGLSLLARLRESHPALCVVVITGHGNMDMAVQTLRLGATDFLTKPVKLLELDAVLEKTARLRALQHENTTLHETVGTLQAQEDQRIRNRSLIGVSPAIQHVREQIKQAVEADCETVLITGETGTGKEVVAREIHFMSGGDDAPFFAVSCPTIPATLIESELFGVVKGAFTGATADRPGYFEMADGGTLFLDEIADLSPSAQAAILRALETRVIRRVGGVKEIRVDVRIVAATNTPLDKLVSAGKFRQDLLYRLNLFTIHLSPLRERPEDILPLAEHFLSRYAQRRGLRFEGFSNQAVSALSKYDYPGNVRELRNLIERAAMLCRSGRIDELHLAIPPSLDTTHSADHAPEDNEERTQLLQALENARWNRKQVARDLGISYSTLRYKLLRFGIR